MSNSGKIAGKVKNGRYQPPVTIEEKVAQETFWERILGDAEKSEIAARNTQAAIEAL